MRRHVAREEYSLQDDSRLLKLFLVSTLVSKSVFDSICLWAFLFVSLFVRVSVCESVCLWAYFLGNLLVCLGLFLFSLFWLFLSLFVSEWDFVFNCLDCESRSLLVNLCVSLFTCVLFYFSPLFLSLFCECFFFLCRCVFVCFRVCLFAFWWVRLSVWVRFFME